MEFSGERVVPGRVEESLWAEHLARYVLSARFVPADARVLDYACGTGYGSALLKAAGATRVVGVDRSVAAIDYAIRHYGGPGVDFLVADCMKAALPSDWFDLVVSFETIEHMSSVRRFVEETSRLLRPGGVCLVSTPNKETYTDERPAEVNPFHIKEFYRNELVELLEDAFSSVVLLGQSIAEGVVFTNLAEGQPDSERVVSRLLDPKVPESTAQAAGDSDKFDFFIAMCRKPSSSAEAGIQWPPHHYFFVSGTNEIRRKRNRVVELQNELEERTHWAKDLDQTVRFLRERLEDRADAVSGSEKIRTLEKQMKRLQIDLDAAESRWSEPMERLRQENARISKECEQLKADNHALTRGTAERRVAFIQSGNPRVAAKCLEVLSDKVHPGVPVTLISHSREVLPDLHDLPPHSEILVTGTSAGDLLALAPYLRHTRFRGSVLLMTGEPGYRRFKLLGLLLAGKNLVIFNENTDCFHFSIRDMFRHLSWRCREKIASLKVITHLRSAVRTLRREGLGELIQKVRERRQNARFTHVPKRWFRRRRRIKSHTFPDYAQPELSVVIPAHNQEGVTYDCLVSILENAGDVRYEIVVVDDASTPVLGEMLACQKNVRSVRFDENQGFVAGCNAGAREARSDTLFFLNSDTLLLPGCFEALLRTFKEYPECGVVGAKLIYPDGTLQEAGGIVWSDGCAMNYGKHDDPGKPEYNYVREVDYCSGAALAVRKSHFNELSGFDSLFAPGYWEDTDLCFRSRAAGYTVLYQPAAVVVHLEGATAGRRTDQGMKSHQVTNQKKFIRRWRAELAGHIEHDPDLLFLARDRCRDRVALVFDHYVPTHDKDAGSYVMYSVLEALRLSRHRVIFWPDNLYRTPKYAEGLQQLGVEVIYGPVSYPGFLREVGPFLDLAIAYRAKIAEKYLPALTEWVDRLAYICVDLEHIREKRRFEVEGLQSGNSRAKNDLLKKLEVREAKVIQNVDRVAVHSPVEREILENACPGTEIIVLPLPVRGGSASGLEFDKRKDLLFVGSSHPPNVDAINFYQAELAQRIRARLSDADLIVIGEVGKTLSRSVLKSPGLKCTGFVPTINQYYEQCKVYLAPLRYGAGIKGKVLEAMSFGLPVVTTPVGAEGIPIEDGVSGFVAEDPEEFADAVIRLYQDRELWQSVRQRAREIIEAEYSIEEFRRRVDRLVDWDFGSGANARRTSRRRE